jgi:metal-responsive CopG/Arc/MetJ family transcriptional regulator
MAVYKVNVSLPEDLVSEIDEAAESLGLSRSGFIAEASTRYVVDVRNLSAEERRHKDMERAAAMFKSIRETAPPGTGRRMMEQLRADRDRDTPPEMRR